MKCEVIQDLLPVYVDGLASEETKKLLEAHLETCPVCSEILKQMRSPEPEPEDGAIDAWNTILRQRKRQRRRLVLTCVLAVLFCAVAFCLYMECSFYDQTLVVTTTDQTEVMEECPQAILTAEEYELGQNVFSIGEVQAHVGNSSAVSLTPEEAVSFAAVIPEGAKNGRVDVLGSSVCVDYQFQGWRVILSYADVDFSGRMDYCRKTLAPIENVDVIYEVIYRVGDVLPTYQKHVTKHVWFSWIKVLMNEMQFAVKEDLLHCGVNAQILSIDPESGLLYVQGDTLGQRRGIDCTKAQAQDALIYVDFTTHEIKSITMEDLQVGDDVTLNFYASQLEPSLDGEMEIEQLQLMTQRMD